MGIIGFVRQVVAGGLFVVALVGAQTASAAQFSAPPGKALVYVLQGETQNYGNVAMFVDRRSIGVLKPNTYIAFSADPGLHLISAAGAATSSFRLTVEKDKVYYVGERINAGGIPVFRAVPPSEAQQLLARYSAARSEIVATSGTLSGAPPAPAARAAQPQAAKPAAPAPASKQTGPKRPFGVIVKIGSFELDNEQQNWFSLATTVDTKSSGVFGGEFEYRFPNDFAVGVELLRYKNSWTQSDGSTGSFGTTVFMVNGKKYFPVTPIIRPYVGAGVGTAKTSFSGDITGSTSGFAIQGMGGAEFLFQQVGVYLEIKKLSADTEDDSGESVDASGLGIFLGASFNF